MTLKTSVKAARLALGTQALSTTINLANKMHPTTNDVVTHTWKEDPNGGGSSVLVPHFERVVVPGLPFEQAIGDAATTGLQTAALATGAYLAVKGGQKLHSALGKQWRKGK